MVRTGRSILGYFFLHFFDARQRSEAKKTRVGVAPLRTLLLRVLHTKNAYAFFAQSHAAAT